MKKQGKSTTSVHGGGLKDPHGGASSPIYPSTAYKYVGVDKYYYPRYFNVPNQEAVENKIAELEGADSGMVFSSGMSAIMSIILGFLKSGDHLLLQQDIYGGTHDSVSKELARMGIEANFCPSDPESIEAGIRPNTRMIFIESPSNPLLKITDIRAIASIAKSQKLVSVIDNTFASPINQNPHALGIDIVMHSATKYLGGHSDISAGVASMSNDHRNIIRETSLHLGGNLDVQACWLLERSMKTLEVRVNRQSENALAIAEFLNNHPKVEAIYYPGLSDHPQHALAASQMSGFGGMLSFEVSGDPDKFVQLLNVVSPVMSLGGVESTITTPAQTSHARISPEQRAHLGIKDNLLRVSTGIEDADDLIEDFRQALDQI